MHKVEIQDGVIQVDASIIGRDLEPFEVQSLRRERKLALMKRRGDTRAAFRLIIDNTGSQLFRKRLY